MPAANPQPIALVVCDNVYVDSHGKRALIGLFNRITVQHDGPIIQRRLCIYVSMTEVYPDTVFRVDIRNAETDHEVVSVESRPAPPNIDPTTIFDFQFELENIVFPEVGTYIVRFSGNEHPLLERPISVVREQHRAEEDSIDD